MILSSFSYKSLGWEIKDLEPLNSTNLIVGKNASGKSRTINSIKNVALFLCLKNSFFSDKSFSTKLVFKKNDDIHWSLIYSFETKDNNVTNEQLIVDGKEILKRSESYALFYDEAINPPTGKLVVQVRRDRGIYPDIEQLMEWAEGVFSISCSDLIPITSFGNTQFFAYPKYFSDLVESLSKEEIVFLLEEAKRLGYELEDIESINAAPDLKLVSIKERYLENRFLSVNLSSGMLRVLYVLFFLQYLKHVDKQSLLLIDDLGEGLDYKRSTLLGEMVIDACEKIGLQLIASSNDSFLMDVVDISNWHILRRNKDKLDVLNQFNSDEMFNHFRMTGLSNFDLLSSDYIETYLTKSQK